MHDGKALNEFDQGTESREQRGNEDEIALRERRRGQSRQPIKRDEVLGLVPRHQLQSVLRRDDGAVRREQQGGEKCDLRQSIEQDYSGHGTSKSVSISLPLRYPNVTPPPRFCI